jgi:hypothetical protein
MTSNQILDAVSNFYTFLAAQPFLPASAIKTAPPEGRLQEYGEIFSRMGKSNEVVCLLYQLPYINDDKWEWFPVTKPINYISPLNLRRIDNNYENGCYLFERLEQDITAYVL